MDIRKNSLLPSNIGDIRSEWRTLVSVRSPSDVCFHSRSMIRDVDMSAGNRDFRTVPVAELRKITDFDLISAVIRAMLSGVYAGCKITMGDIKDFKTVARRLDKTGLTPYFTEEWSEIDDGGFLGILSPSPEATALATLLASIAELDDVYEAQLLNAGVIVFRSKVDSENILHHRLLSILWGDTSGLDIHFEPDPGAEGEFKKVCFIGKSSDIRAILNSVGSSDDEVSGGVTS